jgi:protein-S-isoprenylcysteine O-methyltransferase Ste14
MPRWLLVLLGLGFALSYVILAVLSFGSASRFFANGVRCAVCAGLFALALATATSGFNFSFGEAAERSSNWIFFPLLTLGILLGIFCSYSDAHHWLTIGNAATRGLGLILFAAGVWLRIAAMWVLGERFSVWVAVQEEHALVTTGLYRLVRHPSYTGALLMLLGWALAFRSLMGVAIVAMMAVVLLARIVAEERWLVSRFGEGYRAYQQRSWRLAPWMY